MNAVSVATLVRAAVSSALWSEGASSSSLEIAKRCHIAYAQHTRTHPTHYVHARRLCREALGDRRPANNATAQSAWRRHHALTLDHVRTHTHLSPTAPSGGVLAPLALPLRALVAGDSDPLCADVLLDRLPLADVLPDALRDSEGLSAPLRITLLLLLLVALASALNTGDALVIALVYVLLPTLLPRGIASGADALNAARPRGVSRGCGTVRVRARACDISCVRTHERAKPTHQRTHLLRLVRAQPNLSTRPVMHSQQDNLTHVIRTSSIARSFVSSVSALAICAHAPARSRNIPRFPPHLLVEVSHLQP
jgi:hypothetical protein